jgi:hypothetical protein
LKWRVLFSSKGGRSFPRVVRSICQAGPTLVALELLLPLIEGGNDDENSAHQDGGGRTVLLLAFNNKPWLTMADRRGAGRDPAAEKLQQAGFFGDDHCFVSLHSNLNRPRSTGDDRSAGHLFKPAPRSSNNCFMFLVDEEIRIGNVQLEPSLGMGGPRGRHLWVLDEDIDTCRLCTRCSTFAAAHDVSTRTTAVDCLKQLLEKDVVVDCRVLAAEVYALDDRLCPPEMRRELERKALVRSYVEDVYGGGGGRGADGKPTRSVLDGNESAKAILTLAGAHEFHAREDLPDQCGKRQ